MRTVRLAAFAAVLAAAAIPAPAAKPTTQPADGVVLSLKDGALRVTGTMPLASFLSLAARVRGDEPPTPDSLPPGEATIDATLAPADDKDLTWDLAARTLQFLAAAGVEKVTIDGVRPKLPRSEEVGQVVGGVLEVKEDQVPADVARKVGGKGKRLLLRVGAKAPWKRTVALLDALSKSGATVAFAKGGDDKKIEVLAYRPVRKPKPRDAGDASPGTGRQAKGEAVSFFGAKTDAAAVVFVIDTSGSMLDRFDAVSRELLRTIATMDAKQQVHVVTLREPMDEAPPRRLAPATPQHKRTLAKWIAGLRPEGKTEALKPLKAAFADLRLAPVPAGRCLYLLTDGHFSQEGDVLKLLKELNHGKPTAVNTILIGSNADRRNRKAEKLLKTVAEEHNGEYRYVVIPEPDKRP